MRRLAMGLLVLFVFTIPWEYSLDLGSPIGNISRIAGLVLLLTVIPAVILAGRFRMPGLFQGLVLALYIWLCLSCFWSVNVAETLRHLRGYFQELMIVWLVWELVETAPNLVHLFRAYVAGSWVLAGLTVASFVFPAGPEQLRFVAEGQDPNDVAHFLDLGFPMAGLLLGSELRWPGRLLAAGYLPLGLFGVLLTASRSGFLAALVALAGCAILLYRNYPRSFAGAALASPIAVAALWAVVPQRTLERIATIPGQLASGDLNQRWDIWAAGWHAFVRAPFLGSGTGTFVDAARLAPVDTAHNTLLALAVEGGIVSVAIACAIVVLSVFFVIRIPGPARVALGACLFTLFVSSLIATVQESRTTWLLLGMIAAAARITEESPDAMALRFPGRALPQAAPVSAGSEAPEFP